MMPTARFAFVMPIVHPDGAHVADYHVVERLLRATVTSIAAQDYADAIAIVVCERAPKWAGDFEGRAVFIAVDGHPAFAANPVNRRVDKGMKYAIGALYALTVCRADWVMLMDGDDFVRLDLASRVTQAQLPAGHDGFAIRRGLHAILEPRADSMNLKAAFEIDDFNKTCGTCRIVTAQSLATLLQRLDSNILEMARDEFADSTAPVVRPQDSFLDTIASLSEPYNEDPQGPVLLLGRHMNLEPGMNLAPLDEVLACKGCSHGNSVGPRGGDVHWRRVRGSRDCAEVVTSFGLKQSEVIPSSPGFSLAIHGAVVVAAARVKATLKSIFRRTT